MIANSSSILPIFISSGKYGNIHTSAQDSLFRWLWLRYVYNGASEKKSGNFAKDLLPQRGIVCRKPVELEQATGKQLYGC